MVRAMRRDAGLSLRGLARAAGVATSTVHRVEQGAVHPTVELLSRLAEAAGTRLSVEARPDYASSLVGLARAIDEELPNADNAVRMAAELVHRFEQSDDARRHRMVGAEPASTADARWDAFLGGLAEWVTVRHGMETPSWARARGRYLEYGWWVTEMEALRAWEYAGTPVSFKLRGVYLHRASLTNV